MKYYNMNFGKNLILFITFFVIQLFPVMTRAEPDWSLPLKKCWSIFETPITIASDNDTTNNNKTDTIFLFYENKIKGVNPYTGKILWETEIDSNNLSRPVFLENRMFYISSDTENKKEFINSIDLASGVFYWRKEIPFSDIKDIFLFDRQILIKNELEILEIDTNSGEIKNRFTFSEFASRKLLNKNNNLISGNNEIVDYSELFKDLGKLDKNISDVFSYSPKMFLWISTDNKIGLHNVELDKNVWIRKAGGKISGLKVFRDTLIFTSFDNFIYLLNIKTGQLKLKKRLDGRITNISNISYGNVAVSAYNSLIVSIINLEKNKVINSITLSDADSFVFQNIFAGDYLIISTPKNVSALSPVCK